LVLFVAGADYESGTFDVIFGVGDTSAEVSINITDDSIVEGSEAFGIVLKRANNTPDLVEIVEPMNAAGIIDDNDETGVCVYVCVCVRVRVRVLIRTCACVCVCVSVHT